LLVVRHAWKSKWDGIWGDFAAHAAAVTGCGAAPAGPEARAPAVSSALPGGGHGLSVSPEALDQPSPILAAKAPRSLEHQPVDG